jgi:hypothetical protein
MFAVKDSYAPTAAEVLLGPALMLTVGGTYGWPVSSFAARTIAPVVSLTRTCASSMPSALFVFGIWNEKEFVVLRLVIELWVSTFPFTIFVTM